MLLKSAFKIISIVSRFPLLLPPSLAPSLLVDALHVFGISFMSLVQLAGHHEVHLIVDLGGLLLVDGLALNVVDLHLEVVVELVVEVELLAGLQWGHTRVPLNKFREAVHVSDVVAARELDP